MLAFLRRWLTSSRPATTRKVQQQRQAEAEGPEDFGPIDPRQLSLDAQLDIANGRRSAEQVRRYVQEGIRRFREAASSNPASAWALSLVDPYDWAMDTPNFYPGMTGGMGGYGVPWMLNNQGRGDVLPVYINEMGLKLIRDWSRRMCAYNEFAINAIENRISYIVGKGNQYTVLPKKRAITPAQSVGNESGAEPSGLAAKAQSVIDEFIARTQWNEREQECVKRCDRDGEAILRFFHIGHGRTSVRFVEPECMTDGKGIKDGSYGVITAPGDVETVVGYEIVENPAGDWVPSVVSAREVLHIKANTDFDAKRGLPTLFAVRKNLERADKLLRNMSVMAQVQATFAVIRRHKNFAPSSVSAYQQGQQDLQTSNPLSGRAVGVQQLYPGSVIDASDKTEYEFPSASVNAGGLVQVLQAELRAIAARLVMPEWMLTVDASNGNFSGQFIAEAPSSKKFERDQAWFARRFGDGEYGRAGLASGVVGALWRVLEIAVEHGLLPPETLTDLEIQVEGPSLIVRNKAQETNRAKTLNEAGVLSMETWAKWEGLDYQQEQALGAKPKQAAPAGPGGGPPPGGGGITGGEPKAEGPSGGGLFEELEEEIKRVFGRCVDTSTHKVVPCPSSPSDNGGADGNKASEPKMATPEQYTAALETARKKGENVPEPTTEEKAAAKEGIARLGANKYRKNLVGNSKDRAKRRKALLEEFGDGKQCPCIYCGLLIGEGTLEQDKIKTTAEGGRYRLPNLVPACGSCNKNRSDMTFGEAMAKLEQINNA